MAPESTSSRPPDASTGPRTAGSRAGSGGEGAASAEGAPAQPDSERGWFARELASVAVAFGWVSLSLMSLVVGLVALLTVFSLARAATPDAHAAWHWLLAVALTFGVPFVIAAWKHIAEPARIRATMAWLPSVWNASGLLIATLLIPDLVGTALRSCEWVVQGHFGDTHQATRALSALGHEAADAIDPGGGEFPAPVLEETRVALDGDIVVPFTEEGAAIFLSVELEGRGPGGTLSEDGEGAPVEALEYLFDTGASYTTITTETARKLGIEVPEDAPKLEFNTASGLRESRMVYLPALRLGDVRIPGLLASVCDSCATEHTDGLLGLNVMREFVVQMDYQGNRMRLIPRVHEGPPNRAYDIEPILTMQVEGRPEIWLGRIRWVITLTNNGTVPIYGAMPRVEFKDGPRLFGERVERIDPGETGRSLLVGEVAEDSEDTNSLEFTLMLAEAHW